jgi:hypothetical protein
MRYALGSSLVLLVLSCVLILGAAQPFERVALEDPAYAQLDTLRAAGLLGGYELPGGELSRLEVSVLIQRALGSYGESKLSGAGDPAAESALQALLASFSEELSQLGAKPALSTTAPGGMDRLVSRVDAIEEELEEEDAGNATYVEQIAPEAPEAEAEAPEPGIATQLYGKFYIQGVIQDTKLKPATTGGTGSTRKYSDVNVYWGELGIDATEGDWSGRFSVLWDDVEEDINVYEAWAKYKHPCNGWFAQAGQVLLPFGNNDYYFPTYPAVNDLSFTTAHALGAGVERDRWGFSAYAFNPKVELRDEQDTLSDYSFVWDIAKREPSECQEGWKLRAGYISHLANSDMRLAGDEPLYDRTGAYNVFGRYDWGGNRFHLIADYTAALDQFDARDLDANGDQKGDQPRALNTEFIYEPCPDNLWGVSYQSTGQMKDYAETRYGVLYGKRLSELAMFKLSLTHGIYGDYATGHEDTDNAVVAEINLNF